MRGRTTYVFRRPWRYVPKRHPYQGVAVPPVGRIMSSLVGAGGLVGKGGIAGEGGGLAG